MTPFKGRVVPKSEHKCKLPSMFLRRTWTVWECGKCQARWRIQKDGSYGASARLWYPFTDEMNASPPSFFADWLEDWGDDDDYR